MENRNLLEVVLSLFVTVTALSNAQPQSSALRFEVASVRPTITQTEWTQQLIAAQRAGRGGSYALGRITGNHYDTDGMTMKALIAGAFQIDARLIVGSDWVTGGEARFALHAVMPEGATSAAQFSEMMRGLLAERFHLVTHRATVDHPAYALVAARTGAKLKKPRDLDRSACNEWTDSTPAGRGRPQCFDPDDDQFRVRTHGHHKFLRDREAR